MLHNVQKCRLFCSEAQMSTLRQLPGSELSFPHICSIPQILVVFSDSYKPYNIIYIYNIYTLYTNIGFIIFYNRLPQFSSFKLCFWKPMDSNERPEHLKSCGRGKLPKASFPTWWCQHVMMMSWCLDPICAFAWFVLAVESLMFRKERFESVWMFLESWLGQIDYPAVFAAKLLHFFLGNNLTLALALLQANTSEDWTVKICRSDITWKTVLANL